MAFHMNRAQYTVLGIIILILIGLSIFALKKESGVARVERNSNTYEYRQEYGSGVYYFDGVRYDMNKGIAQTQQNGVMSTAFAFGAPLSVDLNDDGVNDEVFMTISEPGDGRSLYYLVGAVRLEKGIVGTEGFLLGDRIGVVPNPLSVSANGEVIVTYGTRKDGEGLDAPPTQIVEKKFTLDNRALVFVEKK